MGNFTLSFLNNKMNDIADFIITRPEKVDFILERYELSREDLKCSVCGDDLSDLKHLRAIYPYRSILISCDKFECMCSIRDLLIEEVG